jgi:hypothetical protein
VHSHIGTDVFNERPGAKPMRIDAIAIGNNPPLDINVIIEVPVG